MVIFKYKGYFPKAEGAWCNLASTSGSSDGALMKR